MERAETDQQGYSNAETKILDYLQAVEDFRDGVAQGFQDAASNPNASKEEIRQQALVLCREDPKALLLLGRTPEGQAILDKMVHDLHGKADTDDDKLLVRAAITGRYDMTLTDKNLSKKYLPRLYDALGMVPLAHTRDNPMLKTINRERPEEYKMGGDYTERTRTINLKATRTGMREALRSFEVALFSTDLNTGFGISEFDALTLHEVGHSVDSLKKYMDTHGEKLVGWEEHLSVDTIADAVGNGKQFYTDHAELPREFLRDYLIAVLGNEAPKANSAVLPEDDPQWEAIAAHPAVQLCEAIRMKGDSGLWAEGNSGAQKWAVNGIVYQQAYEDNWVQYSLASRGQTRKVSDYQYRAPGEWYAEVYASFFLGTLPENHPVYASLEADRQAEQ
jgi:hypothetical protein